MDKRIRSNNIEYLGGKLYADAYFSNHSGNNYLLRTIHEPSGMETGQFLNVTKYNKEISNTIVHQDKAFFFRENGNLVFVQWFMDHIIEITKDSISSLIDIKSKDVLTTDNIRIAMEKNAHTYTVELMQLNKYYHIYSFIEHGNWIIFQMQKGFSLLNIFLNKQTGESQVTGFWNDLLLSGKMGNPAVTIGCQDASGVYYYVSVRNISKIKELAKTGALSSDLDKLEDLKKIEEDANPVLFYYEFKD